MRACNPKHKRAGRVQAAAWVSLLKAQASREVGWKADLIWHGPTRLEVPLPCPASAAVIQERFASLVGLCPVTSSRALRGAGAAAWLEMSPVFVQLGAALLGTVCSEPALPALNSCLESSAGGI